MELFVVNAFAEDGYEGNPAGVCFVETFPPDEEMRVMAARAGFSETALVARLFAFVVLRVKGDGEALAVVGLEDRDLLAVAAADAGGEQGVGFGVADLVAADLVGRLIGRFEPLLEG